MGGLRPRGPARGVGGLGCHVPGFAMACVLIVLPSFAHVTASFDARSPPRGSFSQLLTEHQRWTAVAAERLTAQLRATRVPLFPARKGADWNFGNPMRGGWVQPNDTMGGILPGGRFSAQVLLLAPKVILFALHHCWWRGSSQGGQMVHAQKVLLTNFPSCFGSCPPPPGSRQLRPPRKFYFF